MIQEPEKYQEVKQLVESGNKNFEPYLDWFEGRETTVSAHEKEVKKALERFRGHNSHIKYAEIAKLCGCSKGTISLIMRNENRCSEEMAERIIKALEPYEGKTIHYEECANAQKDLQT